MNWYTLLKKSSIKRQSDIDYTAPFFQMNNPQPLVPVDQMVYWLKKNGPDRAPPEIFVNKQNIANWQAAQATYSNLPTNQEQKQTSIGVPGQGMSISLDVLEKTSDDLNRIADDALQYLVSRAQNEPDNAKLIALSRKMGLLIESYIRQAAGTIQNFIWNPNPEDVSKSQIFPFYRIPGDPGNIYIRPSEKAVGYTQSVFRNLNTNSPLKNINWSRLVSLPALAQDLVNVEEHRSKQQLPKSFDGPPNTANMDEYRAKNLIENWQKRLYMVGEKFLNERDPGFQQFINNLSASYSPESVMAFLSIIKGITRESLQGNFELAKRRSFEPAYRNYRSLMQNYGINTPHFPKANG